MAEQPRPDDLAQLRAELDTQRSEFATFRAQVEAERRSRRRPPHRFLPLALVGLLVALLPLSILAAGPFGDLNAGRDAANADIQVIADAGITKGCNPPDFTNYCPNDLVTREQMASFLARTAGLGTNPPVANAKTAQNAAQLGGQSPAFYQPAAQPIANAQNAVTAQNATNAAQLGGSPASAFVRGSAAFTHTATSNNVVANSTTLDSPLTNGRPNARVFVTQNFQPNAIYNAHETGVYYFANRWQLFNEDNANMPLGASFNILVVEP